MKQTFRQALYHVNPTVVIFLGDLTDEGEIADDWKFDQYMKRFTKLFETPEHVNKIYIPGDNDIGGEWPNLKVNVDRFKRFFGNDSVWNFHENLEIISVNVLSKETPKLNSVTNQTRVIITHYPFFSRFNFKSNAIINSLQPTIIFSGHNHKSIETIADQTGYLFKDAELSHRFKMFDLADLKNQKKLIEFEVSTCSYRMGTLTIGYAQAIFDNGMLKYSPLFVISRFYQFAFYIVAFSYIFIVNIWIRTRNRNRKGYEKLTEIKF